MERSRNEKALKFSEIWWKSRNKAGVSQEWMAIELGVSKKTIQNWEKGTSSPSLRQALEWFEAININPYPYLFGYLYPEFYGNEDNEEAINFALHQNIEQMSIKEKKQLLFLMVGNHGSSWHHLLQMFTAHCHTNLKSRVLAANLIINSYEMDYKTGNLYCKDDIMPDVEMLKNASGHAKESVFKGKMSYFGG